MTDIVIYILRGTEQYLQEVVDVFRSCLANRGISSRIVHDFTPGQRVICFGANNFGRYGYDYDIPEGSIVVNMEQIYDGGCWTREYYLNLMKKYRTWDFSRANQRYLRQHGIEVEVFTHGYIPEHDSPRYGLPQDIDVLMIATPHPRRNEVIDRLKSKGVNAIISNTLWGEERSRYLQRAKIILNIHYHYVAGMLELPRITYCLTNRCFIISEECTDIDDYPHLKECLVFAPYDQLETTVIDYLKNPEKMHEIAERGYLKFKTVESSIPSI